MIKAHIDSNILFRDCCECHKVAFISDDKSVQANWKVVPPLFFKTLEREHIKRTTTYCPACFDEFNRMLERCR